VERTNELFSYEDVPVSQISGNPEDDETTIPVYFIQDKAAISTKSIKGQMLVAFLEEKSFQPVEVVPGGLGLPRSGTRNRR
jgi:L-lysine 6-oxidase